MKNPTTRFPYCGTREGWNHHIRNYQASCEACNRAHADYQQAYRIKTGRTKKVLVPVDMLAALIRDNTTRTIMQNHLDQSMVAALEERMWGHRAEH